MYRMIIDPTIAGIQEMHSSIEIDENCAANYHTIIGHWIRNEYPAFIIRSGEEYCTLCLIWHHPPSDDSRSNNQTSIDSENEGIDSISLRLHFGIPDAWKRWLQHWNYSDERVLMTIQSSHGHTNGSSIYVQLTSICTVELRSYVQYSNSVNAQKWTSKT